MNLLTSISSRMGIETPQIVTEWGWEDILPIITQLDLVRSSFRFPEDTVDGDVVLSEAQIDLREAYADIGCEKDLTYYYSLFVTHYSKFSDVLTATYDVSRLGTIKGITAYEAVGTRLVILAESTEGIPTLWIYNVDKLLVEESIHIGGILEEGEYFETVSSYDSSSSPHVFSVVTSKRLLVVLRNSDDVVYDDVDYEWDLSEYLSPGYSVGGAHIDASLTVFVLDSANKEVVSIESETGAPGTPCNVSAIEGSLNGLAYDTGASRFVVGSGSYMYFVDDTETLLTPDNIKRVTGIRRSSISDFMLYPATLTLSSITKLGSLDVYNVLDQLTTRYTIDSLHPQAPDVVGLWSFDESVDDLSGYGNNGTLHDAEYSTEGRFGGGVKADGTAVGKIAEMNAAGVKLDPNDGSVVVRWMSAYKGTTPPATDKYLWFAATDSSNYIYCKFTPAGALTAEISKGGVVTTVSLSDAAILDDQRSHLIYVSWDALNFELYVDGVLAQALPSSGTYTGAVVTFELGYNGTWPLNVGGSAGMQGIYEELVIRNNVAVLGSRYLETSGPYSSYALSGRDPDDFSTNFRDKLQYYFGEYVVNEDYEQVQLPPNLTTSSKEIIFRQDRTDLVLGHSGGLARLFGLLLDRIVDRRRYFMNHLTASSVEYEFIDDLGLMINAVDFDSTWNVDQMRRFLEVTYLTHQFGGAVDAFRWMARFLGFRIWAPNNELPTLVARRKFDSVVNPLRVDTPFDTSNFDSGGSAHYLAKLLLRFYEENTSGSVGSTSIPATREFTDVGATFISTTEVGSMLKIYDVDTTGDNGEYLVTTVVSDTVITVERDFPTGSLAGLSYTTHWRVPNVDPYVDDIISRFRGFKARWQQLALDEDLI